MFTVVLGFLMPKHLPAGQACSCLFSELCHYLGLLVHQQCDRLTGVGGGHRDAKERKAVAIISQHISREGLT